jgi:hypothetical protein
MMEQAALRLPVKLVPSKSSQIIPIVFFSVFLGFAIFWTTMAATMTGKANFGDPGTPEFWLGKLFPFFGVPFMLVGAGGIGRAILKMLPGSPYYHLEINADGILLRSLLKQKRYAWRELPQFETLERRRRSKSGVQISWYTVAMESLPPKPGMPVGATYQREVLRIFADEYGAKNGQQDAADLAAWLNQLRELAQDKRLNPAEEVEVPEGFRGNAISAGLSSSGLPQSRPSQTVIRRQ